METLFSNPLLPIYVYATLSTACLVLGTMYLFKKKPVPLPDKVDLDLFLKGDANARKQYTKNMLEHRFVVFHCDDITRKSIAEYRKTAIGFFNLSEDDKTKYSLGHDQLKRKVNKGYLQVKGVKEYIKLQGSESHLPSNPSDFPLKFTNAATTMHSIASACLDQIAKHEVDGKPYIKPQFYEEVWKRLDRSSVSFIRYFAVKEGSPDDQTNNSNEYELVSKEDSSKDTKEDGMTYPSKTHTDTGILTLIICSDVPGLQVWDHINGGWIEVEKKFTPGVDLFAIMGRKIELFYDGKSEKSAFKSTTHRVALPLNTERCSLLYFLDVPM